MLVNSRQKLFKLVLLIKRKKKKKTTFDSSRRKSFFIQLTLCLELMCENIHHLFTQGHWELENVPVVLAERWEHWTASSGITAQEPLRVRPPVCTPELELNPEPEPEPKPELEPETEIETDPDPEPNPKHEPEPEPEHEQEPEPDPERCSKAPSPKGLFSSSLCMPQL